MVFVGSPSDLVWHADHHWNLPANLPRFYVTDRTADALSLRDNSKPHKVTIFAKAKWSCLRGRNVIGFIPGADPKFGESLPQTLVLAAPLDNLGEVPTLSPAAREAANLAAC